MKKILLLLSFITSVLSATAQNCSNTSVGLPPINDLGTGTWRGFTGGLYPGGSNTRPAAHNAAGLALARGMKPLDGSGAVDTANGSIVWLSIGMSNATMETQVFIPEADTLPNKNPKLTLIDGAESGQDITIIMHDTAAYWSTVRNRLMAAGLSPAQVQVVWVKEAEKRPSDTAFATYPDALKIKFRATMQVLKRRFPNLKLCYISSRIYAGYATTPENPEPYAYYTGWTIKRLIEDQMAGDTALAFSGSRIRAPWLAWGPYLWADGTTPRSDGLTWLCPNDFNSDGTHPNATGRQKVADMLLKFFTTDSTAMPWFLKQASVQPTGIAGAVTSVKGLQLYPQPAGNRLMIALPKGFEQLTTVMVTNLSGKAILEAATGGKASFPVDISALPAGMYVVRAGSMSAKFVKE